MTGVSDFSAKVSRHVSQRLHTSITPLTEANLYRHTVTSPPSQEAKLKHILGYVELQRELIALEEDLYRSVTDKGHWHNTTTNNNNYSSCTNNNANNIELHSSQLAPHRKNTQYPDDDQLDLLHSLPQQHPQQQPALVYRRSVTGSYHQRKNSSPNPYTQQQQRTPPPLPSPALFMQQHHQQQQQQQQLNQSRLVQQHQQKQTTGTPAQRHLDNIPDGLDPTMALPRALPRTKMTHHDQTLYRDSFYSGIGQENDWRQLEELDPDSLAGIHLYGDTSDLHPHATFQQQRQQQPSPAAASSPLNKYPTYEHTPAPAPRDSDWQHERHLQQLQQQAILRQLQYPDDEDEDEDEAKVQMATRHRRQHSIAQAQQLQFEQHQRQLVSPPPTFIEKEKKAGRFSARFSFLTRRRQQPQQQPQHQRSDSVPNAPKESWLNDSGNNNKSGGHDRLHSLGHRRRSGHQLVVTTAGAGGASPLPLSLSGGPGATTPVDEEQDHFREEGYSVNNKNKNRVKQMFRDVFGISKKKSQSPDLAFRDISLPSTHIRSSSTPAHHHQQLYGHPPQLDPSINSQYNYSAVVAQRKGLITPVSRPDTAQSSYRNGNDNNSNSRNQNNNHNRSKARESLVDPVQQLGFQKMEFDEDYDILGGVGDDAFPEGHNPYCQTSLTPPPASSVLRHSTSPHRSFLSGSAEYEPVLITAAVVNNNNTLQQQQLQSEPSALGLQEGGSSGAIVGGRTSRPTRPPSQMINATPTPKDYVDSGCDSSGGNEQPYTTTASNATTLNQHHTNTTAATTIKGESIYSQQQQQPYLHTSPQPAVAATGSASQHQRSPSYDNDRAMTISTYDNGPTIVSMAQVQKVDLEGLRQSHGHYSLHQSHHHQTPPSHHSHHLGMVAVESPFA